MGRVGRAGAPEPEGQPTAHQDPPRARRLDHRPRARRRPRPLHACSSTRTAPTSGCSPPRGPASCATRPSSPETGSTWSATRRGDEGSLARIVRIRERTTLLRRSADDTDEVERIIVANADQLMIVVAAANPEPRPRLVDRYLVAAYDAGIAPMMVITKTDLRDPDEFLANFAGLDIPVFRSGQGAHGVEERVIHELAPHWPGTPPSRSATRASASRPWSTRWCRARIARSASSTPSPGAVGTPRRRRCRCGYRTGGWIIDTPGVRSFGLGHVNPDNILKSFSDLLAVVRGLPARLHPPARRAGLRPQRGGRRRPPACRAGRLPAAAAALAQELTPPVHQPSVAWRRDPTDIDAESTPTLAEDLAVALTLAGEADLIAMERYRAQDLDVQLKPDRTQVTDADKRVETMVRDHLASARPQRRRLRRGVRRDEVTSSRTVDRRPDRRHVELRQGRADLGTAARAGRSTACRNSAW